MRTDIANPVRSSGRFRHGHWKPRAILRLRVDRTTQRRTPRRFHGGERRVVGAFARVLRVSCACLRVFARIWLFTFAVRRSLFVAESWTGPMKVSL